MFRRFLPCSGRHRETAEEILEDGKLPVLLGGEHLVTLGAVRAVFKRYPDLHMIHFDAHADLREDYLGARLSHACVLRRCWELLGDKRIHQLEYAQGIGKSFAGEPGAMCIPENSIFRDLRRR